MQNNLAGISSRAILAIEIMHAMKLKSLKFLPRNAELLRS